MDRERDLLQQYFEQEAKEFPGKVAYLYGDGACTEVYFGAHQEERVVSASTVKVPVMLKVLADIEAGKDTFSKKLLVKENMILEDSLVFEYGQRQATLYELLVWMIVNSDNTATNVLLDYIGFAQLNEFFGEIGLTETRIERHMLDDAAVRAGKNNYISPMDFNRCMSYLLERQNVEEYQKGYEIMTRNRDYECLLRYLYQPCQAAHKTGGLDDIVHDAGVITTTAFSYFLGIFVSEFEPEPRMEQEASKLIGRLSKKVYEVEQNG